jgi:hypothetical protein
MLPTPTSTHNSIDIYKKSKEGRHALFLLLYPLLKCLLDFLYQNSMPLACPRGILKELRSGKCIITILSRAKNDIKNTKSHWKNGKIFGKLAGKMYLCGIKPRKV